LTLVKASNLNDFVAALDLCLARHKADKGTHDTSLADKLYAGTRLASVLGFAAEISRLGLGHGRPTPDGIEAHITIVTMALRIQLKAQMVSEAHIISERTDELLKNVS